MEWVELVLEEDEEDVEEVVGAGVGTSVGTGAVVVAVDCADTGAGVFVSPVCDEAAVVEGNNNAYICALWSDSKIKSTV